MNANHPAIVRRPAFRQRQNRAAILLACFLLGLSGVVVHGHPDLEEQIARLTLALEKEPANASLWLRRSDARRLHREFDLALADLATAARLQPAWPVISLARARTCYDALRIREALTAAEDFLKLEPDHAEGLLLRAQCWARLGQVDQATAGYTAALRRFAEPSPDLFLERARLQASLGRLQDAVAGLDEGVRRIGPAPALELASIEFERQRGDLDAAVTRADALVSRAAAKEPPQALRAELLEQAGRFSEAQDAFQRVLLGIGSYPPNRRALEATRQLERRAREGLARVGAKLSHPHTSAQGSGGLARRITSP